MQYIDRLRNCLDRVELGEIIKELSADRYVEFVTIMDGGYLRRTELSGELTACIKKFDK